MRHSSDVLTTRKSAFRPIRPVLIDPVGQNAQRQLVYEATADKAQLVL
jgi:hypothetical protein